MASYLTMTLLYLVNGFFSRYVYPIQSPKSYHYNLHPNPAWVIVSNCGKQAILRVQIDTNISWVLLFANVVKSTLFKKKMHPCMVGYRLLVGIAALSIFPSAKNSDNPFFRGAIVIFCTQHPHIIFYQNPRLFP